jgi:hypothetical protein
MKRKAGDEETEVSQRKFMFWLDEDVRAALEAAAKLNERNITQEIRHRLRRSIEAPAAA